MKKKIEIGNMDEDYIRRLEQDVLSTKKKMMDLKEAQKVLDEAKKIDGIGSDIVSKKLAATEVYRHLDLAKKATIASLISAFLIVGGMMFNIFVGFIIMLTYSILAILYFRKIHLENERLKVTYDL